MGLVIVEGLDVEQLVTVGPQIRTAALPAWSTIATAVEVNRSIVAGSPDLDEG